MSLFIKFLPYFTSFLSISAIFFPDAFPLNLPITFPIKALKESREGEGTLSLKDIAEILKEVLSEEEIYKLIVHLEKQIWK